MNSSAIITNNLVFENSSYAQGGGVIIYGGNLTMVNNTIAQNHCISTTMTTYGAGLTLAIGSGASGSNNILYGNTAMYYPNMLGVPAFTHSCCPEAIAGTGNITSNPLFTAGPNSAFYLSQIAAGQALNSPCVDSGNPATAMLTGTTRTDLVQDAGIIDMGYHIPLGASAPSVEITLMPVSPPIVIPATGGSFNFNAVLDNNTSSPQTFDVWIMIQLPNGSWYGPALGPLTLTIPANLMIERLRTQSVPGSAPAGNYWYQGRVGDYPSTISDSSGFAFSKSATGDGAPVWDWSNDGQKFDPSPALMPREVTLLGANPNPFNPMTIIGYELREAGHVILRIYDTTGRSIVEMINGYREAGQHQVIWDASGLSAGIYFARLDAARQIKIQKLLLIR